jgi:riboflavin kinase / FMN adenylyltransferase
MRQPLETNAARGGGAWLTIGSFDGVHFGHQQVVRSLVEKAKEGHAPAVVVTFFPHPQKVLREVSEPFYLSTPEEKNAVLHQLGVNSILTIHFDRQFSQTPADRFMRLLHRQLGFTHLMIGHDFRLGANREGDYARLEHIGSQLGYQVTAIQPVQLDGETVSSSQIRTLLREGNISQANCLLGRTYQLEGPVVHGDGRGRHIGIPTANLAGWREKLIPATGVYAAFCQLAGQEYQAVVNIGPRPTFYETPAEKSIEVHILDFKQEIYGQPMRLRLVERIRPEIKFSSADELMDQIRKDIGVSREVLAHASD